MRGSGMSLGVHYILSCCNHHLLFQIVLTAMEKNKSRFAVSIIIGGEGAAEGGSF